MERILVALSGGIDSAVAAWLLRAQGRRVIAVTLRLLPSDATALPCAEAERLWRAARIARQLGLPHRVWDARDAFEHHVVGPFVAAYARGETPNPCVRCNAAIKVRLLLEAARRFGCERIATGHYAGCVRVGPPYDRRWLLARGRDSAKDQSYMLWAIEPAECRRLVLPLGGLSKARVRQLAAVAGLQRWVAGESQDLCFTGPGGYARFLARRLPGDHPARQPGPIRDREGRWLGRHRGWIHYTVGQRRGLGVASPSGRPLYVLGIEPDRGTVTVGEGSALAAREVTATAAQIHWPERLRPGSRLEARVRYRQTPGGGVVQAAPAGELRFRFDHALRGIAPGQSLVLYDGPCVVAGGILGTARGSGPQTAAGEDLDTPSGLA